MLGEINSIYSDTFNLWDNEKEQLINNFIKANGEEKVNRIKDTYSNDNLTEILKNSYSKKKIKRGQDELIQIINPIFQSPSHSKLISLNEPLFLHEKKLFNSVLPTMKFNLIVIWTFSLIGFIALYFEWLKKLLNINIKHWFKKKKSEIILT